MKRFFSWLRDKLVNGLKRSTFFISKAVTTVVMTGGALCGITRLDGELNAVRLGVAGMIFVIGLPIGLLIFGQAFNIFIWMGIVIGVLFLMNLHSAWDVIIALRAGGLDYVMAAQAVEAASTVVPTDQELTDLRKKLTEVNERFNRRLMDDSLFDDGRLLSDG
jgi:hypothetical protein